MSKEQYQKELKKAMLDFENSYKKLVDLCYDDNNDINDYIVEDYPFNCSLDELGIEGWAEMTVEKIDEKT